MPDNQEYDELDVNSKLLKDFSLRVLDGDSDAGFELAQFFWGCLPSNEVGLHIAVIEALIYQSAELGSTDAKKFLNEMWPDMKNILKKRLIRRGFEDKYDV